MGFLKVIRKWTLRDKMPIREIALYQSKIKRIRVVQDELRNMTLSSAVGCHFYHRFSGQLGKTVTLCIVCNDTLKLCDPLR